MGATGKRKHCPQLILEQVVGQRSACQLEWRECLLDAAKRQAPAHSRRQNAADDQQRIRQPAFDPRDGQFDRQITSPSGNSRLCRMCAGALLVVRPLLTVRESAGLTAAQVRQIKKRAPQGTKRLVRSSLFDVEAA
jgi:DNA-binding GntR family transcriptional regulator